jgi:protease-4
MEDKKIVALVVVIVVIIMMASLFFVLALVEESGGAFSLGKAVALVEIEGSIITGRRVISEIEHHRKSEGVAALVIRIDSPGGGVVASHEIYRQIHKFREEGKPVVVSMGTAAASGAYYLACAADTIVASPGTLTGSIGVIIQFPTGEELLRKIGLRFETIKSGRLKDAGSPFRDMNEDDRRMLDDLVDDSWRQFVAVVSKERSLPLDEVEEIADGRILTGRRAMELGLVDKLGTLDDAILIAGEMAEIKGEPRLIRRREAPKLLDFIGDLIGGIARAQVPLSLQYRMSSP